MLEISFFLSSFIFTDLPSPLISFSYLLYLRCRRLRRHSSLFNLHILVAPKPQILFFPPLRRLTSDHKNQRDLEIRRSKFSLTSMATMVTVLHFDSISEIVGT